MSEFIYGRRSVLEALRARTRSLHKVWIGQGTHGTEEILKFAREQGIPVEMARREHLDKRVSGHHQGIVAQISAAKLLELDEFLRKLGQKNSSFPAVSGGEPMQTSPWMTTVVIALDEIQDPHNVGAILRSAAFFGVAGALVPKWRSAPVGETASRVSSGAVEHVPLIRVTNLAQSILDLQENGFEVIGADMAGEPLERYTPGKRSAIVFGSEGTGLRRLVRERCDKLLAIPGAGKIDSLNVASTAAIFLYEFCRRSSIPATATLAGAPKK